MKTRIKSVTLEGFQTFAEAQTIPLGPVTLIFGPNSAGKSAIADGIEMVRAACAVFCPADSDYGPDFSILDFEEVVLPHLRRTSSRPTRVAPKTEIGVELFMDRVWWAEKGGLALVSGKADFQGAAQEEFEEAYEALLPWLSKAGSSILRLVVSLESHSDHERWIDDGRPCRFVNSMGFGCSVFLDGKLLLRFGRTDCALINLGHPALDDRWDCSDFQRLSSQFGSDDFSLVEEVLRFSLADIYRHGVDPDVLLFSSGPHDHRPDVKDALSRFADLFNALWLTTARAVGLQLKLLNVPASRTIPTPSQVTYFLTRPELEVSYKVGPGIRIEGCSEYESVATSACSAVLSSRWGETASSYGHDKIARINAMLADHMFKERGYYLTARVLALSALSDEGGLADGSVNVDPVWGYLVTLVLRDAEGRRLGLGDVGSGIGYALPVLFALASEEVVFIQQPELHLHPALQADMADAIAAASCEQVILETHSEHLLLRMLRRVRQGANPALRNDPHAMEPEDLVVLYVCPELDGASTVKRLRVDRNGEFLDRWPRGFFEERWNELFDE